MHSVSNTAGDRLFRLPLAALTTGAALCAFAEPSYAQTTFTAALSGAQETPANASAGSGVGTITLNAGQTMIVVDLSWQGLSSAVSAAHIHGPGAPAVAAPVLFAFTGVPAAATGVIPEQTFAVTPAQVHDLQSGLFYFNVHTTSLPGGEIRGQVGGAPEPPADAATGLGALCLVALAFKAHRRNAAT